MSKKVRKSLPLAVEGARCAHWADEVESHRFCTVYPEIITFQTVANHHFDAIISTDGNLFLLEKTNKKPDLTYRGSKRLKKCVSLAPL